MLLPYLYHCSDVLQPPYLSVPKMKMQLGDVPFQIQLESNCITQG